VFDRSNIVSEGDFETRPHDWTLVLQTDWASLIETDNQHRGARATRTPTRRANKAPFSRAILSQRTVRAGESTS